jgi:adenylosuccinate lyase
MELTPLSAVSPVDGRYRRVTSNLAPYFSEGALIKYRARVEMEYFIALCRLPLPQLESVSAGQLEALRQRISNLNEKDILKVKEIEHITNHDVKAVEYFLQEIFEQLDLKAYKEFIHFGLTSQDINNTALPLLQKEAWQEVLKPEFDQVLTTLTQLAKQWQAIPMLARTHGQPASPTYLGKELFVFVKRLLGQLELLQTIPFAAKFGGATGNFNAHKAAYPGINWIGFGTKFVNETLGLCRTEVTTQIEPYDHLAAFCDNIKRLNTILIDLNRDMWAYISMEYFKQKIKAGEVGSSTMPHKVNPIDFENSEGNLGIANAVLEHLAAKLPISRLQRDLTDSTVTRNLGVPLAHTLIALRSLSKGLGKIILNQTALDADLEANWAVVAEGIQTILRREGYPNPYEALKDLTRTNKVMDATTIGAFIDSLNVSSKVKAELKSLTPMSYTGSVHFD